MTKRGGFRRREQPVYLLPVLITDSGSPALSSTNTLPVRVCDCDSDGVALACGAVAYTATGLSTGALLAILSCIITLLGKALPASRLPTNATFSCCGFAAILAAALDKTGTALPFKRSPRTSLPPPPPPPQNQHFAFHLQTCSPVLYSRGS